MKSKIIPKNIRGILACGYYSEKGELRAITWWKERLEKEPELSDGIPIYIMVAPRSWREIENNLEPKTIVKDTKPIERSYSEGFNEGRTFEKQFRFLYNESTERKK